MRSKDDICFLYFALALIEHKLYYIDDEATLGSVQKVLEDIRSFARDIVDNDYEIRTIDPSGNIYIPTGPRTDLASFTRFGLDAECTGMLSTALVGYEDPLHNDCQSGICYWYEQGAYMNNMANYKILRMFHMASVINAYNLRQNEIASELVNGLIERLDDEMELTDNGFEDSDLQEKYNGRLAVDLLRYAATGIPLTSDEVRFIHEQFSKSIESMNAWPYWNMWDPTIPDGVYDAIPDTKHLDFVDFASFIQMCDSPFYNETGQPIVDCNIILHPELW